MTTNEIAKQPSSAIGKQALARIVDSKPGQVRLVLASGDPKQPDTALAKLTRDGTIRSFALTVKLPADMMYSVRGGKYRPTAEGYKYLRGKGAAVKVAGPDTMMGESGRIVPNPEEIRDPATDRLLRVRIRKIGWGRDITGNLSCMTYTLTYDLRLYYVQDLFAKLRSEQWQGKGKPKKSTMGDWGAIVSSPDALPDHLKEKRTLCVPVGMGYLAFDLDADEVLGCFGDQVQRERFACRLADTIAERNVLASYIPTPDLSPQNPWVRIYAWAHQDPDEIELAGVIEQVQSGEVFVDGARIPVRQSSGVADPQTDPDHQQLSEEAAGEKREQVSQDESKAAELDRMESDIRSIIEKLGAKCDQQVGEILNDIGPFGKEDDLLKTRDPQLFEALHAGLLKLYSEVRGAREQKDEPNQKAGKKKQDQGELLDQGDNAEAFKR